MGDTQSAKLQLIPQDCTSQLNLNRTPDISGSMLGAFSPLMSGNQKEFSYKAIPSRSADCQYGS